MNIIKSQSHVIMSIAIVELVSTVYKCLVCQNVLEKTAEAATKKHSAPRPLRICKLVCDCSRSREVERLHKCYLSPLVSLRIFNKIDENGYISADNF